MIQAEIKERLEVLTKAKPAKRLPMHHTSMRPVSQVLSIPWKELHGHSNIVVQFSRKVWPKIEQLGEEWLFAIPELDVYERAASCEEAKRQAGDRLAADVNRLTRAFVAELSKEERERRSKLLACVDLLGGEIGIDFPKERWLLGRVRESLFVPVQDDLAPIVIPPTLQQSSAPEKLWFACVTTYRDGRPQGDILGLEPAPEEDPTPESPE